MYVFMYVCMAYHVEGRMREVLGEECVLELAHYLEALRGPVPVFVAGPRNLHRDTQGQGHGQETGGEGPYMNVWMYVCMYVLYVYMHVCTVCIYSMYACMYVCTVCMYACMYMCMYV